MAPAGGAAWGFGRRLLYFPRWLIRWSRSELLKRETVFLVHRRLGTVGDGEVGQRTGRTLTAIRTMWARLRIPAFPTTGRRMGPAMQATAAFRAQVSCLARAGSNIQLSRCPQRRTLRPELNAGVADRRAQESPARPV
jgi:hypothetical protein